MSRDLLDAIAASPDDDAPRLVYADWLTEHGEPARGELIAIQCQLARGTGPWQRARLARREAELLPALPGLPRGAAMYRRGLLEGVTIDLRELLALDAPLPPLALLRPQLPHAIDADADAQFRALARSDILAGFPELDLSWAAAGDPDRLPAILAALCDAQCRARPRRLVVPGKLSGDHPSTARAWLTETE